MNSDNEKLLNEHMAELADFASAWEGSLDDVEEFLENLEHALDDALNSVRVILQKEFKHNP